MVAYTYSRVSALNFNTTPPTVAKSGTGAVYAVTDTTFTTPLNVTMVVGGAVATALSSDANGFFPDFTVEGRTSVVWKQNASTFTTVLTTTDPVPGPAGPLGPAGAKGDRGDLATWQTGTSYQVNQVIANPSGDLVKVTTAHISGATYDATKFGWVNNNAANLTGALPESTLPGRLSDTSLSATYVGQGKEFLNLNVQPGVDMTGNTECGAAVQTAIDLARTRGLVLIGTGQIKAAIGLTIISDVDLTRVVLNYNGPSTTTAITVGNSGGIVRKDIKLPYVVNLNKAAGDTGWGGVGVAGTVGVSILNCGTCRITVPAIYKFETGLLVTGNTSKGSVYNTVDLGEIIDNKVNVKFICPGGYTNQNTFIGGRIGHSAVDVSFKPGTRNILMANGTISEIAQGNTFLGASLESPDFVEFQLECWGENNLFIDCSWETNTNTSRAAWRATAKNNQIIGGVQASTLIITADAGATANDIITSTRRDISSTIKFTGPGYDIGGTAAGGADKPRYIRANTAIQTGFGATPPAAGTAGAGAIFFDQTTDKPKFSNSVSWLRADSILKTTKTASYTMTTAEVYDLFIFNGASLTATLPDPTLAAQDVRIVVKNIAATALTVNSAGTSKTLDGAASQSLAQWAKATYVSDGTQWLTV